MRRLPFLAMALALTVAGQPLPKRKAFMKGPLGPPPEIIERFSRLSPDERKEALGKLPPERREAIERRLERWNSMSPEERSRMAGSYARFQEMTPERQQEVRQLFRRFNETFTGGRRQEAHSLIRKLRRADPEERKSLLNDRRFTDEERKVLEQMANEQPPRPMRPPSR